MMLAEPAARYLFAAVLQQSEPEQRSEDFGLHRVGRPVPHLRKHRRIRNSAKPRQFLGGLPVIGKTNSDQSTIPASAWGQDPRNPRPKLPRSMCQNAR